MLYIVLATAFLFPSKDSSAQYLNNTLTSIVSGGTNTGAPVNTGTDTWVEDPGHTDPYCVPLTPECDDHNRWQVDVFDGPNGLFTWRFKESGSAMGTSTSQGSITLASLGYAQTSDPDVVIARLGHEHLWAMIVGISDQNAPGFGRILVTTLRWNPTTQAFVDGFGCSDGNFYLGATWPSQLVSTEVSGVSLGRTCNSPNIDANRDGQVAIVWAEVEPIQIILTWGWPFFPATQTVTINRGNVFGVNGDITGYGIEACMCRAEECKGMPFRHLMDGNLEPDPEIIELIYPPDGDVIDEWRIEYEDFCGGMPIGIPAETEDIANLVSFTSPDVCISENSASLPIVTYTFYRNGFTPGGYRFGINGMVVTQDVWGHCYWDNRRPVTGGFAYPLEVASAGDYFRKENFTGLLYGPSRLAAPGLADVANRQDFTLVQGANGGWCDSELGDVIVSPVRVWGRRDADVTDAGLDLNLPSDEFDFQNGQPVVSHWSEESSFPNRFFVGWTARSATNGELTDILTKAYELEITSTGTPLIGTGNLVAYAAASGFPAYNDSYSFVNEAMAGGQAVPSIASRHFRETVAFSWSSRAASNVVHQKWACYSSVSEGTTGLDFECFDEEGGGDGPAMGGRKKDNQRASVSPNPSENSFAIKFKLEPGEKMIRAEIYDPMGKSVDSFQSESYLWKPKPGLPTGVYTLRIQTSSGSFVKKVLRK